MPAIIEPITFVVRSGPQYFKPGDPYTFTCTVVASGEGEGRVVGALGEPEMADLRAAMRTLRQYGLGTLWGLRGASGREALFKL